MSSLTIGSVMTKLPFVVSIDDGIEEVKQLVETHRFKDLAHPRYSNQRYLEEHEPR